MKDDIITLAHGSGGRRMHELIRWMTDILGDEHRPQQHDSALLTVPGGSLAFTTDSFVVKPLFFAGGDIGRLAVCGTVNDLAMAGACPLYLSVGMMIEEGFGRGDLERILVSMREAAAEAGVKIVTGDTKVVERGALDGVYINTSGIGAARPGTLIGPDQVRPGQDLIVSGNLGEHALAVMAGRHHITLPATVASDCAPLNGLVDVMLRQVPELAFLRDPTRGGLATTVNEVAAQAGVGIMLDETALPIRPEVQAVCDLLGYDPLYLANEGKLIAIVDSGCTEELLAVMRSHPYGRNACRIGQITAAPAGQVGLRTVVGGVRLVDMLEGEQFPRIC